MVAFHKLCRTAWSSRGTKTESVSVTGHARSEAVISTGWDEKQRTSFWRNYKVSMRFITEMTSI